MRMFHLPRCLALSVCLLIGGALGLATSSAQAATTVTVDGKQWSVSTKTFGPFFADIPAELSEQVWVFSKSMAYAFTEALKSQEGSFNGKAGPYFYWGGKGVPESGSLSTVYVTFWHQNDRSLAFESSESTTEIGAPAVFAIASEVAPVPLPATGVLLVASLGGVAALRRRRRAR